MDTIPVKPSLQITPDKILSLFDYVSNPQNKSTLKYAKSIEFINSLSLEERQNYLELYKTKKRQSEMISEQYEQLRAQSQAMKNISRNQIVTPELLNQARGERMEQMQTPSNNNITNPMMGNAPIISNQVLYKNRDVRIQEKIENRKNQIYSLPSSIPDDLKVKAMIELKQLQLLPLQKKLRSIISASIHGQTMLSNIDGDPTLFRKSRTSNNPKDQPVVKEKAKRSAKTGFFLDAVLEHAKKFREFHQTNQKDTKKFVVKQVERYWSNKEKREQQQRERDNRERIKFLREDNEQAYLDMLKTTKNERLNEFIDQTNQYLKDLAGLIILEKKKISSKDKENSGNNTNDMRDDGEDDIVVPEQMDSARDYYYKLAHTKQEKITQQPKMLTGQLKPYQMVGLEWMVSLYNNRLNGILADEMGLGKTIQTISLVSYLMEAKKNNGPYLVIVPLSTLPNWVNEFTKWTPTIDLVVYRGSPTQRKKLDKEVVKPRRFNVMLTTFDYIIKDKNALSKVYWSYIIVDEGHRMKNHQSKLSQVLTLQYESKHRLILTGTPLQNSIPELWALLNFILPTIFQSFNSFSQWFSTPFEKMGEKSLEMNEEENLLVIRRLQQILRPFLLRRLKSDVESQLPQKIEKTIRCPLSEWQRIVHEKIKNEGILQSEKGAKGLTNTISQMRLCCNHPYLLEDEWIEDENFLRVSGKFELLDRVLPKLLKTGHRVLIFNQFKLVMNFMEIYLNAKEYKFLRLDGETKIEDRQSLLEQFNQPNSEYDIFIISTRAGGQGINLQTADTVIIFDSDWNPQMDQQALSRVHRIGQTKEVLILRFVTANSVEEKILSKATHKLGIDQKLIGAGTFNPSAKDNERKSLLKELLSKEGEHEEEDNDIPTEEQVCSMIARSEDEYELFLKMDEERQKEEKKQAKEQGTKVLPRLITKDELPEYLLVPSKKKDSMDISEENYGRGKRRKNVQVEEDFSDLTGEDSAEGDQPEEGQKKHDEEEDKESEESEEQVSEEEKKTSKRGKKTTKKKKPKAVKKKTPKKKTPKKSPPPKPTRKRKDPSEDEQEEEESSSEEKTPKSRSKRGRKKK